MVSCTPVRNATLSLVPTPSVPLTSTGSSMSVGDAAEPREAADVAHDLGDAGGGGQRLDALDQLVARVDVHPGLLVRQRHGEAKLARRGERATAGRRAVGCAMPPAHAVRAPALPRIHPPSVVAEGAAARRRRRRRGVLLRGQGGRRRAGHAHPVAHERLGRASSSAQDVFVGPAAVFTNVRHPRAAFPRARTGTGPCRGRRVPRRGCVLVAPVRVGRMRAWSARARS